MPRYTIFSQYNEEEEEEGLVPSQRAREELKKKRETPTSEYSVFPQYNTPYITPERPAAPPPEPEPPEEPSLIQRIIRKGKEITGKLLEKITPTRNSFKEEFGIEPPAAMPAEPHGYFDYHAVTAIPAIQSRITELDQKQQQRIDKGEPISGKIEEEQRRLRELMELPNDRVSTVLKRSAEMGKISASRGIRGLAVSQLDLANSFINAVSWQAEGIAAQVGIGVKPLGLGIEPAIKPVTAEEIRKVAKPTSEQVERWADAIRPENPNFADQLTQGVGSALAFFIPGYGIARGAGAFATVSPRLALFFGNVASTALESASEAGSVYEDNLDAGKSEEEADRAASKTFFANVVLVGVTNRLGIFGETAHRLKRILLSSGIEGFQEYMQQAISNVQTGRTWDEGTIESGVIGSIIGGGLGSVEIRKELEAQEKLPAPEAVAPPEAPPAPPKVAPPKPAEEVKEVDFGELSKEDQKRAVDLYRQQTGDRGSDEIIRRSLEGVMIDAKTLLPVEERPEEVEEAEKPKVAVGEGRGLAQPMEEKTYYRGGGEGEILRGKTAQDIINFEVKELGNRDITIEKGVDLRSIPSERVRWYTETKGAAREYGKVETVKGRFKVLARDSDGGVLVDIKPEEAPPTPEKPTAIPKELEPLAQEARTFDSARLWKLSYEGIPTDKANKVAQQLIDAGFIEKPPVGMVSKKVIPDFEGFYTQATTGAAVPAVPKIEIEEAPGLKPEHREIERRFAAAITADLEGMIRKYQSKYGNVINTDKARELSEDYARSDEARSELSFAVHEPASALIKEIYGREVQKPAPEGKNNDVLITAGGSGVGKTFATAAFGDWAKAQIIYDTNLSSVKSGERIIGKALENGKKVIISYVWAAPEVAFRRTLDRAAKRGRSVPSNFFIDSHVGSLETVKELYRKYSENPDFEFRFIDNNGAVGEAKEVEFDFVDKLTYNKDELREKISAILEDEYAKGQISETIYQATKGAVAQEKGRRAGVRYVTEPERKRPERERREAPPQRRVTPPTPEAKELFIAFTKADFKKAISDRESLEFEEAKNIFDDVVDWMKAGNHETVSSAIASLIQEGFKGKETVGYTAQGFEITPEKLNDFKEIVGDKPSIPAPPQRVARITPAPAKKLTKTTPVSLYKTLNKSTKTLPAIERYVGVRGSKEIYTDLTTTVVTPSKLKDGMYNIVGNDFVLDKEMPIDEYIEVPKVERRVARALGFNLEDTLAKAQKYASTDRTRETLTGINLVGKGGRVVAATTDGYRIFVKEFGAKLDADFNVTVLNAEKLAKVFRVLNQDQAISINVSKPSKTSHGYTSFSDGTSEVIVRNDQANYPTYQNVYPAYKYELTFDRKQFSQAVKEVIPYAKERANITELFVRENELVLAAEDPTTKARKEVAIPVERKEVSTKEETIQEGSLVMPVRIKEKAEEGAADLALSVRYLQDVATTYTGDKLYFHLADKGGKIDDLSPVHFFDQPLSEGIDLAKKITAPAGVATKGAFSELEQITRTTGFNRVVPFPEMVRLARLLGKQTPAVRKLRNEKLGQFSGDAGIAIDIETFKDPVVAAKTLAHEVGHLTDWLPEGTLARGNLVGRIASLEKHLKRIYGELDNKVVRAELLALSEKWRPIPENASDGYIKYRRSSRELYADAISVLLNDPGRLENEAPEFFLGWTNYLDRKPEVRREYLDIQQLLGRGDTEINKVRLEEIYKGFEEGRKARIDAFNKELGEKSFGAWFTKAKNKFLAQHVTKFSPSYQKLDQLIKQGKIKLSDKQAIRETLEEMAYSRNDIWLDLERNEREVADTIKKAGITEDQLGAWFELERNLADRMGLANPDGLIGDFNREVQEYLESTLNKEQQETIRRAATNFHKATFEIADTMHKEGMIKDEVFQEKIEPFRDSYVTYGVVKYIEDNYVTPHVKTMKGTLEKIENPYVTTMFKRASMLQVINLQRAKRAIISNLKEFFPDEVEEGKYAIGKRNQRIYRRAFGKGQVGLYEDGTWKAYDVDPYFEDMFTHFDAHRIHTVVDLASKFNRVFKPTVTTYKIGWALYNNPIKDVTRTLRNLAAISKIEGIKFSRRQFLADWARSIPQGFKFGKGELTPFGKLALGAKAISTPWVSYDPTAGEDKALFALYRRYKFLAGVDTLRANKKIKERFTDLLFTLLRPLEVSAATFESTTKLGSFRYLNRRLENQRKIGFYVRNYTGTPNYLEGGSMKEIDNSLMVFSNVMIQGTRADLELVKNPKSRGAYFFEQFLQVGIPKVLMVAAASGFLGKKLEDKYARMTEYDKTNLITVPLCFASLGKVAYWRIPTDEVNRLAGAIIWKTGMALQKKAVKPEQILDVGAGWLPSMTPIFDIVGAWFDYIRGINPYDSYYGRGVLDYRTQEIRGFEGFKKMTYWTLNSLGVGNFATYDPADKTTVERILQFSPVLSRALRVSDYGMTEIELQAEKAEKKERAIEAKREDDVIQEQVKKYLKEGGEKIEYKRAVVRELGIKEQEDKTRISKEFDQAILKKEADARIRTVMRLQFNTSKIKTLKKYRGEMEDAEFREMMTTLRENKVISDEVYREVLK